MARVLAKPVWRQRAFGFSSWRSVPAAALCLALILVSGIPPHLLSRGLVSLCVSQPLSLSLLYPQSPSPCPSSALECWDRALSYAACRCVTQPRHTFSLVPVRSPASEEEVPSPGRSVKYGLVHEGGAPGGQGSMSLSASASQSQATSPIAPLPNDVRHVMVRSDQREQRARSPPLLSTFLQVAPAGARESFARQAARR